MLEFRPQTIGLIQEIALQNNPSQPILATPLPNGLHRSKSVIRRCPGDCGERGDDIRFYAIEGFSSFLGIYCIWKRLGELIEEGQKKTNLVIRRKNVLLEFFS